jgi:hypothetical protein
MQYDFLHFDNDLEKFNSTYLLVLLHNTYSKLLTCYHIIINISIKFLQNIFECFSDNDKLQVIFHLRIGTKCAFCLSNPQ